jgi:hypothetical protein
VGGSSWKLLELTSVSRFLAYVIVFQEVQMQHARTIKLYQQLIQGKWQCVFLILEAVLSEQVNNLSNKLLSHKGIPASLVSCGHHCATEQYAILHASLLDGVLK